MERGREKESGVGKARLGEVRARGRGMGGGAVKGRRGWVRKNQINGPPAADRQTTRPVYFSTAADLRLKRSRHMTWIFTS